jgi:hypothetical protein
MILIKKGEKRMPNKVRANKTTPAMVKAIWVSFLVSSSDLWVIYSVYTGMKEMVKDPSPTKRLHRLGILKATKKASAAIPVPKKLAMTISLRKPRIRLRKVPIPMMEAALVILWFSDIMQMRRMTTNGANKPDFERLVIIRLVHHLESLSIGP